MMPVFIFAREAMDVVLAGEKKLIVPEDARITMAAWEVIKDHGLEVVYQAPVITEDPVPAAEPEAEPTSVEPELKPGREILDEDVELILNRVIARLEQVKGEKPQTASSSSDATGDDLVICRCEEITRGEIREVIRSGMTTLNGIKRVTRAGMGLCQGQTCQRLVIQILCRELGLSPAEVQPTTARAPVRPVLLSALATG